MKNKPNDANSCSCGCGCGCATGEEGTLLCVTKAEKVRHSIKVTDIFAGIFAFLVGGLGLFTILFPAMDFMKAGDFSFLVQIPYLYDLICFSFLLVAGILIFIFALAKQRKASIFVSTLSLFAIVANAFFKSFFYASFTFNQERMYSFILYVLLVVCALCGSFLYLVKCSKLGGKVMSFVLVLLGITPILLDIRSVTIFLTLTSLVNSIFKEGSFDYLTLTSLLYFLFGFCFLITVLVSCGLRIADRGKNVLDLEAYRQKIVDETLASLPPAPVVEEVAPTPVVKPTPTKVIWLGKNKNHQ